MAVTSIPLRLVARYEGSPAARLEAGLLTGSDLQKDSQGTAPFYWLLAQFRDTRMIWIFFHPNQMEVTQDHTMLLQNATVGASLMRQGARHFFPRAVCASVI